MNLLTVVLTIPVIAIFHPISLSPIITLNGENPTVVTAGSIFVDPGVEAIDDNNNSIQVVSSNNINSTVSGKYTINYSATDINGLNTSVDRTVYVELDATKTTGAGSNVSLGNTTLVSTIQQFKTAVENALPGDIIKVADGVVIGNSYSGGHRFKNIKGTSQKPITITTSSRNPATISTANWNNGIPLSFGKNCEYIIIENLILDGGNNKGQQGLNIGGTGFPNKGTAHHITVDNIEVYGSKNAGIKIAEHSHNILIKNCKVHDIGINQTYGEGIYLGEGNDKSNGAHHIALKNNEIYNTNAEAIDIKISSSDILIEGNYIHDINVSSQGAIVVCLNRNQVAYNANVIIKNNMIHRVTTRSYDGNAIVAASGNTWIYNNTIWDIVSFPIDVYQDFNNPASNNVYVYNNTIWTSSLPRFNVGKTSRGPGGFLATVFEEDNIYQQSRSNNFVADSSDFVSPITGNADAGGGAGSGFEKANSAPVPNVGYCTAKGNASDIYIKRFTINPVGGTYMNNNSGLSSTGYSDFSNITIELNADTSLSNSMYVIRHWDVYSDAGIAVWIDYNKDNDFEDAGELVASRAGRSQYALFSFIVPATALSGITKMRVAISNGTTLPNPCGTFADGEVEDYTVNIIDGSDARKGSFDSQTKEHN